MVSLSMARSRTRLGRVSPSSLRTQARKFSSPKGPSSKKMRSIAITTVIGMSGFWWMVNTRHDGDYDGVPLASSRLALDHQSYGHGPCKTTGQEQDQEVTRILSQEAYSFLVRNVAGVVRYDCTQLASNTPCEDRFFHGKFPSPWNGNGNNDSSHWLAWAVFDGHAGCQTAELLKHQLLPFVRRSLSRVSNPVEHVPATAVQRAIMQAFINLDDSIIKSALQELAPAWAGSCALLSLYDPASGTLHVACTGDSRAVLGQRRPDGAWDAIPLSVDQTGRNEEEIARVYNEHPGEEDIVKDGRVLGMMVSRAFGDALWKWPVEFQQEVKRRFYGPRLLTPRYDVRTPPYLTAEPVVTSTKIDPSRSSFLILATDGLWDFISSQQGVELVGKWLETQGQGAAKKATANSDPEPTYDPFDFGQFHKGVSWKFVPERTTVQDKNVAVHMVRNALGGNHRELVAGRLAFDSPFSRRVRDDITVQVVFFNTPGLDNE